MNTKLNIKSGIQSTYNDFFACSKEHDFKFDAKILMYRFMSEVERLCDENNINKKELGRLIGTSASYITQLYRGDKLLNLETVAKFQKVFDIRFDVKAYPKDAIVKEKIVYTVNLDASHNLDFDLYDYTTSLLVQNNETQYSINLSTIKGKVNN